MNGHSTTSSANGNGAPASPSKPFRIAIVGGAIGGLSTALLIDHFCRTARQPHGPPHAIAIDVYEQASEYREIGAGVGLGLNSAKLMHTVPGVGAGLKAINGDRGDSWFTFVRYDNGQRITHVDGPVKADAPVRPASIARSEYLDLLLGIIRERNVATLHTSKKFVAVKVCIVCAFGSKG